MIKIDSYREKIIYVLLSGEWMSAPDIASKFHDGGKINAAPYKKECEILTKTILISRLKYIDSERTRDKEYSLDLEKVTPFFSVEGKISNELIIRILHSQSFKDHHKELGLPAKGRIIKTLSYLIPLYYSTWAILHIDKYPEEKELILKLNSSLPINPNLAL